MGPEQFFFQVSSNRSPRHHAGLNPALHLQPWIQHIGPGAGGPRKLQTVTSCQQRPQISQTSVAYQASSIFPTLISTRPAPAFISKDLAWYLQKKKKKNKKFKKLLDFLRCSWLGALPLKCEHVAEMLTCSLQAACSTGDSTNDCKRLLETAFGWPLPFFLGSLGSALSSCHAGGFIWVQCTHVEHSPSAISSPSRSQRPAGRAAAPSCWSCWCSPVLAL